MKYWLIKTEPGTWSWEDQCNNPDQTEHWDGVRNFLANKHMKEMRLGDRAFFYHSVKEKKIVGIVEVVKEHYPDHTDEKGKFGMVDFKVVMPVEREVTLEEIKGMKALEEMVLVKNSRLSVQPVTKKEWGIVCKLAGVKA
ncbi:EVE domain protein [Poriferisphaera corsica]|uniref:EVE domain protein n=1 Tax=Poriferisphaera corsica TaxID=2528020 RepID=A0A517YS98_9BACT|nr:EVE domain-containing protein [Poriferisphaera corsica]QDU33099.1 EVE domain protein [Poriferisphaera corsica]